MPHARTAKLPVPADHELSRLGLRLKCWDILGNAAKPVETSVR